jgi:NAD(P)-dependent dehydrogenase (short-subunit alcohol dehydrogenase family)
MELRGRWALVTGGHVRVGREISLALARRAMSVAVTYRSSADAADRTVADLVSLGVAARALRTDLADPDAASHLADRMLELAGREGGLALLVNNASVYPHTQFGAITAATWDAILAVNLRAPFLLSQQLGLVMRAAGGGKIVNIADWAGLRPYRERGRLPYMVSKAGLIHMTRVLAIELAPEVQVNCVCPGAVLLPEGTDAAEARAIERATPLRRFGSPADVAAAVLYLVEGTDFATGSVVTVDGGRAVG